VSLGCLSLRLTGLCDLEQSEEGEEFQSNTVASLQSYTIYRDAEDTTRNEHWYAGMTTLLSSNICRIVERLRTSARDRYDASREGRKVASS